MEFPVSPNQKESPTDSAKDLDENFAAGCPRAVYIPAPLFDSIQIKCYWSDAVAVVLESVNHKPSEGHSVKE